MADGSNFLKNRLFSFGFSQLPKHKHSTELTMNKVSYTEQKTNFAPHHNLKTESKIEFAAGSDAQSAVALKIEQPEKRTKRALAKICIPHTLNQVWQVLTDYESFPEFMPGLSECRRLRSLNEGVRIEQVRGKSFMGISFSASSVIDVEEKYPNKINYQLFEGDMNALSGYWQLKPIKLQNGNSVVELIYDFTVSPKRFLPMALVEHVLSNDIPDTMVAIRQRVAQLYSS